jgi:uncharacterized protein (DUF2236 family)
MQPHPTSLPDTSSEGLAGPPSVAWKINGEVITLFGWGPAILLQLAHPLVAAGVAEHSRFLADRHGRLRRLRQTLRAMLALTFGDSAQVAQAADGINRIHDSVNGELREDTPAFPAGTRYSAHDPELLRWVHATLLEMLPRTYELYVGPLTPAEKDRYCLEASGLAPLLGIPDGYLPTTMAENRAYMECMYASGQISVTNLARALAREIVYPPHPLPARPQLWLMRLPTLGLLPPAIRQAYGLPWTRRDERALERSAALIRRLLPLTPTVLRHWPAARAARRRARQGVAGG